MQNTFQSGICGQEKSSTAEILGSLSQAITGYVPIVTMLGNEVRARDESENHEVIKYCRKVWRIFRIPSQLSLMPRLPSDVFQIKAKSSTKFQIGKYQENRAEDRIQPAWSQVRSLLL